MKVGRGRLGLRLAAGLVIGLTTFLMQVGGAAAAVPTFLGSFGPDGTSASNFERAGSVAVDGQSGDVYVLDVFAGALYKFDSEGHPVAFTGTSADISGNEIREIPISNERGESQVAVDPETHTIYVASKSQVFKFEADGEPGEFTAGPGAGTAEITGFGGKVTGVAVDANGNIYVSDFANGVAIFARSGESVTSFSVTRPGNLAVAPDGSVYVVQIGETATASKWSPSGFPVSSATTYSGAAEPIDPNETFTVAVDSATENVYLADIPLGFPTPRIAVYDKTGAFIESIAGPGQEGELHRNASGVGINPTTETIYASSASAEGEEAFSQVGIFGPEHVGPPTFAETFVAKVTSDSGLLGAVVDANGAGTIYRFEYGLGDCSSSACTVVPIGGAFIGGDEKEAVVSAAVTGLSANTTYHFRVVAENSFGSAASPDRTFLTQSAALGFGLEDSRVWEMVSPPNKHGGVLMGSTFGLIQAAADGEGIVYASRGSIEPAPEGNRSIELSNVLGQRTDQGWLSRDITPPNHRFEGSAAGQQTEFNLFTPDLSTAVLEPRDGTELSPEASERTPYLRNNTEPPTYTPLVTGREGFANVPSGTEFGGDPKSPVGSVRVVGANENLSRPIVSSVVPLVNGAPPLALYAWAGGKLLPVSVLPGGGVIISANLIGSGAGSVRNAVSADGSRVFWSPGTYGNGGSSLSALYMRDLVAEKTVQVDAVQGGTGEGTPRPAFQTANADGTVVYFTDSQQLTADASAEGRDLYRCEIAAGDPSDECLSLIDISAPMAGSSGSTEVEGLLSGASGDGETLYFVARGVLDTSPGQSGEEAAAGQPNLYVWREGVGIRFIAKLSNEDSAAWGGGQAIFSEIASASSPSGRYFAFMSQRSLTGYNNRDAEAGNRVEEVFQYDSVLDKLQCVSCDPSGSAPSGQSGEASRELVDPRGLWNHRWLAAVLPEPTSKEEGHISLYQPRGVLDDGRVFFNGFDAIVPVDSNVQWDVYQYEPIGVGSCSEGSSGGSVVRSGAGCVSLISSATQGEETGFLDASTSGSDVFFLTSASLSPLDEGGEFDVYDARVNGMPPPPPSSEACSGEGCRSTGGAPPVVAPGSWTFQGAGNIRQGKQCPKGKRKVKRAGKSRCVKPKHRTHKRHHKHSSQNGRQGK